MANYNLSVPDSVDPDRVRQGLEMLVAGLTRSDGNLVLVHVPADLGEAGILKATSQIPMLFEMVRRQVAMEEAGEDPSPWVIQFPGARTGGNATFTTAGGSAAGGGGGGSSA